MIVRYRLSDVLQQNSLTRARRSDDQSTLPFTLGLHDIDYARRFVFNCRIERIEAQFLRWI